MSCSKIQQEHHKAKLQLDTSKTTDSRPTRPLDAIENINFANEYDSPTPSKNSSRQVQNLEMLHQSVTKSALKPIVRPKKPSHDFSKDSQLQLSFLRGDVRPSSSPKQSTNYSDDWLHVLPSPSELFKIPEQDHEAAQVGGNSKDHYAAESNLANRETYDLNLLEDFDQHPSDDERCDMETTMVGLSDSITMQEMSSTQGQDAATGLSQQRGHSTTHPSQASFPILPDSIESVVVPRPSKKTFHSKGTSAKVLLSAPEKRYAEVLPEGEDTIRNSTKIKRQKRGNLPNDSPVLQSAGLEPLEPAPSVPTIIKPGQPAWVYDFDPAFIAEYQDFVDFV